MNHDEPLVIESVVDGVEYCTVIKPGALRRFADHCAGHVVYPIVPQPAPKPQRQLLDERRKVSA